MEEEREAGDAYIVAALPPGGPMLLLCELGGSGGLAPVDVGSVEGGREFARLHRGDAPDGSELVLGLAGRDALAAADAGGGDEPVLAPVFEGRGPWEGANLTFAPVGDRGLLAGLGRAAAAARGLGALRPGPRGPH